MDVVSIVVGLALVGAVVLDLLWTTLWSEGAGGPITARIAGGLSRAAHRIAGSRSTGKRRLRSATGPAILSCVLAVWVIGLYAGWALVFLPSGGVVSASTGEPAGLTDRLYYVGYNLFTLGLGDFRPRGWLWQLASVLISGTGLILITLAITYLVPVVSASTSKRALAGEITSLGKNPEDVALALCRRAHPAASATQLSSIATQLNQLADQHLAYPVLHYFHSSHVQRSSPVAIALLDEALTLLMHGVEEPSRPAPVVLGSARSAVGAYVDTLASGFVPSAGGTAPAPDLSALRRAGVDVADDSTFAQDVEALHRRRRLLLDAVVFDGRQWPGAGHGHA